MQALGPEKEREKVWETSSCFKVVVESLMSPSRSHTTGICSSATYFNKLLIEPVLQRHESGPSSQQFLR